MTRKMDTQNYANRMRDEQSTQFDQIIVIRMQKYQSKRVFKQKFIETVLSVTFLNMS